METWVKNKLHYIGLLSDIVIGVKDHQPVPVIYNGYFVRNHGSKVSIAMEHWKFLPGGYESLTAALQRNKKRSSF